ncbi:MAG: HAMP domain-containing protein [Prevotella sp.]|nr:HAMP domain-containing protein [Prevotella sp.]
MKNIVRHIRQSLSLKLSLGILLMAVTIFVVSLGILFIQSRKNIKREAMERAVSELNATAQRVYRYLGTVETATNSNAWSINKHFQPETLLEYSYRIVAQNANVSGCSITAEPDLFPQYGKYFSAYSIRVDEDSVTTVKEGEYDYFSKVWYKTPTELGKACWIDPFDDFNEGTLSAQDMIASYCMPLYDDDGRQLGVISTDLSLAKLSEVISAEKPYPHAYFIMLGKEGHYYVHPDTARLVKQTIFNRDDVHYHPDVVAVGHEMTAGHEGAMRVIVDGEPSLVCYQPVKGTHWSLALICPESDILYNYNQLKYIITPLLLIGLVLIMLLCRRIVTNAISPLNRLVEQSQRIAAGQYDEQIPHTRRRDVVGRLQNSFATMQESLNRHVSDIKRVNAETEQRNEELQQARLLAEEAGRQKAAFTQDMTHQIRTPLNIIMGFAQVLRENIEGMPKDELRSITDMMNHNAMSLNRMVLMLYDSSETGHSEELRSKRHERVPCNDVARECISQTQLHFPDLPIKFETTLKDTYCIHSNRLYLMRSLREVLYNAAKYSDGQHVTLSVSKTKATVRFITEDTGPGISEEYHHQMFMPFTKVDNLSEGLGLGLPLSKRHARNLGGDLTLDTNYHAGCRFILELPISVI